MEAAAGVAARYGPRCESCGRAYPEVARVRRRVCTGSQALCDSCRASPEHKIMTEAALRRLAPQLPAHLYPAPLGSVANCVNPAFRRQRVYAWGDVALRCAQLSLPLPD